MINYKLAKEIGATHYHNRTGEMYKVDLGSLLVFRRDDWVHSGLPLGEAVSKVEPIPPKRTRTEYEKVTESIFDLRDEFERGELYGKIGDTYELISSTHSLALSMGVGMCYRRVEVEIDERKEFIDMACEAVSFDIPEIAGLMYDAGCRFQD